MNADAFRKAAHGAIEEIIQHFEHLPKQPVVSAVGPGYLRPLLPSSAPFIGESWPEIQNDMNRVIVPGLTHWQHPAFMAYFPAPSTFPAILGELYSAAYSAPAFNWVCSPAITELETIVLDWLAEMMSLPRSFMSDGGGGGVIQGSACEAILSTMVAARERMFKRRCIGHDSEKINLKINNLRGRLVALGSEQAHSSSQKGALIAGTRYMKVPAGLKTDFVMKDSALKAALEYCDQTGLVPYHVTLTLGTTAVCSVDDFKGISKVLQDWPDVWVHVDAAYAGAALVCQEHQYLTKQFAAFNSYNFNMHKWMLTNFDARSDLTGALSITPSYLQNSYSESGLVIDYRDWQIPLSRRFRALKVWFVLRSYGVQGVQRYIRHTIGLGELFHRLTLSRPDLFFVLSGPVYALTVITIVPASPERHATDRELSVNRPTVENISNLLLNPEYVSRSNCVTKKVHELVEERGQIYLASALIDGIFAIRVNSAGQMVNEHFIKLAFDVLVDAAEDVRISLHDEKRLIRM